MAQSLQPGTPEYNEVFDIAVLTFPTDAPSSRSGAVTGTPARAGSGIGRDMSILVSTRVRREREFNLNAAVNALRHGDLDKAEAYLLKAGKSPQADYIRGIIAAKRDEVKSEAARPFSAPDASMLTVT